MWNILEDEQAVLDDGACAQTLVSSYRQRAIWWIHNSLCRVIVCIWGDRMNNWQKRQRYEEEYNLLTQQPQIVLSLTTIKLCHDSSRRENAVDCKAFPKLSSYHIILTHPTIESRRINTYHNSIDKLATVSLLHVSLPWPRMQYTDFCWKSSRRLRHSIWLYLPCLIRY